MLALAASPDVVNSVLVTGDGLDWAALPIPSGFSPWKVDIAGDRWVIQGWDTLQEAPDTLILFSDDRGSNWTELAVDYGLIDGTTWVADVIAAGKLIVVMAQSDTWQSATDEVANDDTEYENSVGSVHLFLSDGGPAELVAEFPGWASGGYAASDGFHLLMHGPYGDQFLYSPDGYQWSSTIVGVEVSDSAGNQIWTTDPTDGRFKFERFEGVYGSDQVLTLPDGIGWIPDLAVGPAGVAAVGGSTAESAIRSAYDPNDFLVGWSQDGTDWQWQGLDEAFGLPESTKDGDSFTEVQVAVGHDFVIAKVQTFVFPEALIDEDTEVGVGDSQPSGILTAPDSFASPPRWFIARVG
jgi:hypothetical protein